VHAATTSLSTFAMMTMPEAKTAARALTWLLALAPLACDEPETLDEPVGHDEPSDLEPYDNQKFDGPLQAFDRDAIVDDTLFENDGAATVDAIQDLLEVSPYGKRSFLADELVDGRRFSEVLVEVATEHHLNPVLLLTRLQVEKSLVSKSVRPGGNAVDFALGCGCSDGSHCNTAFRGLDRQLTCAAEVLRASFDASVAGTGTWLQGKARKTLDKITVRPRSHATAALYAYTPWVLQGKGGNWLVWNVNRKFIGAMIDRGTWDVGPMAADTEADGDSDGGSASAGDTDTAGASGSSGGSEGGTPEPGSCVGHCGDDSAVPLGDGHACFCDDACVGQGDCCNDFALACGG
jgi:hypothetical protein